jgi:hypothetical protein
VAQCAFLSSQQQSSQILDGHFGRGSGEISYRHCGHAARARFTRDSFRPTKLEYNQSRRIYSARYRPPPLQYNTTIKSLNVDGDERLQLTGDEDKQMAALLQKNYALDTLSDIELENEAGDVGTILRLNEQDVGIWFQTDPSSRKASEC